MKETLVRPTDDLEQVMDTYGNMLFRLCLVLLGNSADAEGETLVEGNSNEKVGITDGMVSLKLPLDELESGNYKLIITEFVGSAKAEQDLPIKGYWVCEFSL